MAKNVTFKPSSAKAGANFVQSAKGTGIKIGRTGGVRVKPGKAPSKGAHFTTNPKANG